MILKDLWTSRSRPHDADRRKLLTQLPAAIAGTSLAARAAELSDPEPGPVADCSAGSLALGYVLYCVGQLGVDTHRLLFSIPSELLRLGREEEIEDLLGDLIRAHNHTARVAGVGSDVIARVAAGSRIADPGRWLAAWRRRLGLSGHDAASLLGYDDADELVEAEAGRGRAPWDKVFVAIWLEESVGVHRA
jgi:hypothetical protein